MSKPENMPAGAPETIHEQRRKCLCRLTKFVAASGIAAAVWPLISALGPDENTLADGEPLDVPLGNVAPGETLRRIWRGKLVFIRHRTAEEIALATALDSATAIHPQADAERVKPGHEQWLVLYGYCPHAGCVPNEQGGDKPGWLCPCHGSEFDLSGRVTRGPAAENMLVPDYAFHPDGKTLTIGMKDA